MGPAVREAQGEDLAAICRLYAQEVTDGTATFELQPPTQSEMEGRLSAVRRQGLPWLVAEIDGGFGGYAYASPFRTRPAYRYSVEVSVYVEPQARGRGVGRALLLGLIEEIRGLGLRQMVGAISDSSSRDASIALHRSVGFVPVGVYRQVGWKFDRWLDVTLMQLDLCSAGAPPAGPGLLLD